MAREYQVLARSTPGYRVHAPISSGPQQPPPVPEQVYLPGMGSGVVRPDFTKGIVRPNFAAGLSKPHNITQEVPKPSKPKLVYYAGASLVDVQGPRRHEWEPPDNKGRRERIMEWSTESRARFKRFMAKIKADALSQARLITLTYPADFPAPEQFIVYKNHLRVFCQALRRRYAKASGVWKLEFQTRGAAHYHLVVLGLEGEPLNEVREWCSKRWYDLAHNGDKHEGKACCQVDPVKSKGGVMNYMGKYLSKSDQTRPGDFTGRYWGGFGKKDLPMGEEIELELTEAQLGKVRRWARKKMEKDVNQSRWKRFLGKDSVAWQFGNRLYWETLKSHRHSGARSMQWMKKENEHHEKIDGENVLFPEQWVYSATSVSFLEHFKLPKKWKARRNDRVQLICNADQFMKAVRRGTIG